MSDYTLSEETAERLAKTIRYVERHPELDGPSGPGVVDGQYGEVEQFIIASDHTQYTPLSQDVPSKYDSYVVGYRIPNDTSISDLPVVPNVGSLTLDISNPYTSTWATTYKDAKFGQPILINTNRMFRGYVFRGDIIAASWMPCFRHGAFSYANSYYPWAPSVFNRDRVDASVQGSGVTGAANNFKFDGTPGWCAIGVGHTILDVSTKTSIGAGDYTQSHDATVGALRNPRPANGGLQQYTISYISTEAVQATIPSATAIKVYWNHIQFRWELITAKHYYS